MSLDTTTIFISIIYGIIGIGYFTHGRKNNFYFIPSGIGLIVIPYFVSNLQPLLLWGIVLIALPFILERIIPY